MLLAARVFDGTLPASVGEVSLPGGWSPDPLVVVDTAAIGTAVVNNTMHDQTTTLSYDAPRSLRNGVEIKHLKMYF